MRCSGNPFSQNFVLQVVGCLIDEVVTILIGGQVNAVTEQLSLTVPSKVVRQEQRPASDRFEDGGMLTSFFKLQLNSSRAAE